MGIPAVVFLLPSVYGLTWTEQLILGISRGPLGILGPILLLLLCLWLGRGTRSPWYVKAVLLALLVLLLVVMFGPT